MTVRIHADPLFRLKGRWWEPRWYWAVCATRSGCDLASAGGYTYTRLGATIARDRAADRLRRTHGGGR